MPFTLNTSNLVTPSTIPSTEDVIASAKAILTSTRWKKGSKYGEGLVQTYSGKVGSTRWFMRESFHSAEDLDCLGCGFEEFWEGLGVDHSVKEAEYIPEIDKVGKVLDVEPGVREVWSLHYQLGPFVSTRTFTILVTTHLSTLPSGKKQGLIISAPFDTSSDKELAAKEEPGVKGRYAAVECITEMDDGRVEWKMATGSSPGGLIPDALASMSIPSAIAKDVKHFTGWMLKRKEPSTSPEVPR